MISLLFAVITIGRAEWHVDSQTTGNHLSSFTLDDLNTQTQQQNWLYTRHIVGYQGLTSKFKYNLAVEAMNMQVAGDDSSLGLLVSPTVFRIPKTTLDGTWVLPREASISTKIGENGLRVGIQ